jgi:hypothetical protein
MTNLALNKKPSDRSPVISVVSMGYVGLALMLQLIAWRKAHMEEVETRRCGIVLVA